MSQKTWVGLRPTRTIWLEEATVGRSKSSGLKVGTTVSALSLSATFCNLLAAEGPEASASSSLVVLGPRLYHQADRQKNQTVRRWRTLTPKAVITRSKQPTAPSTFQQRNQDRQLREGFPSDVTQQRRAAEIPSATRGIRNLPWTQVTKQSLYSLLNWWIDLSTETEQNLCSWSFFVTVTRSHKC